MTIRESLARWICPDLGKRADDGFRLRTEISVCKDWLGHDFPMVQVVLDRITISAVNYTRALDEPSLSQNYPNLGGIWPWEIYSFREKLRTTFLPKQST